MYDKLVNKCYKEREKDRNSNKYVEEQYCCVYFIILMIQLNCFVCRCRRRLEMMSREGNWRRANFASSVIKLRLDSLVVQLLSNSLLNYECISCLVNFLLWRKLHALER